MVKLGLISPIEKRFYEKIDSEYDLTNIVEEYMNMDNYR